MSESNTPTTRTRDVTRYYLTPNKDILARNKGVDTVHSTLARMAPDVVESLAVAMVIHELIRGARIEDILAGRTLSDRTPPGTNARKTKEPSAKVRAIAQVKGDDMIRAARAGGGAPDKVAQAEIRASALAWAKTLTKEQVAAAMKSGAVKTAYDKLTGASDISLDAALGMSASEPQQLDEAAD